MDPITIGIGVASIAGGLFGSRKANKLKAQALALQREQLQFNKDRYNDYVNQYGELEDMVVDGAKEGVVADLDGVTTRAANDVAVQFKNQQGQRLREMQRYGLNPNSGRAESYARRDAVDMALGKASNITTNREAERRNAANSTWDRRLSVHGLGLNKLNGITQQLGAASNAVSNTLNNNAASAQESANSLMSTGAGFLVDGGLIQGLGSWVQRGKSSAPRIQANPVQTYGYSRQGIVASPLPPVTLSLSQPSQTIR